MAATRKKTIPLLTTAAGLGILLVAGVVLCRPLEERYWLWKLTEGDEGEKVRASDRLAELGVEEAVPILVGLIPRQLPGSHAARSWIDFTRAIRQDRYWKRALVKQHEFAVPYLRDLLKEEPSGVGEGHGRQSIRVQRRRSPGGAGWWQLARPRLVLPLCLARLVQPIAR